MKSKGNIATTMLIKVVVAYSKLLCVINLLFQGRRICCSAAECKDKEMGITSNSGKADVPKFDRVLLLGMFSKQI